jgi:hypothetical protein
MVLIHLIGKRVRDTTVLPHVQAGRVVNDHVRAKLHACVSALRDIGHGIYVKTNLTPTMDDMFSRPADR